MKTKRFLTFILAICLIASMMLGLCACAKEPVDALKDIQEDEKNELIKQMNEALDPEEKRGNAVKGYISVQLSDAILALLSSGADGIDFSWINNTKINYDAVSNGSHVKEYFDLALNDKALVSLTSIVDMENLITYCLIPELNKGYYKVDFNSMADIANFGEIAQSTVSLDAKTITTIIERYYNLFWNGIGEATKTSGEITANGVTQACDVYEVVLTEVQFAKMAKDILNAILVDEEIKTVFLEFAGADAEEQYEEFLEKIRDAIADIESDELSENEMFRMLTYVNKKKTIGYKVIFTDNSDDGNEPSVMEFFCGYAETKNDKGFEIFINCDGSEDVDDTVMSFTFSSKKADGNNKVDIKLTVDGEVLLNVFGTLTEEKGMLAGNLEIALMGETFFIAELSDIDVEKAEDGYFNGHISLSLGDGFLNMIQEESGDDISSILAGFSLSALSIEFDIKSDKGYFETAVAFTNGKSDLFSLTFTGEKYTNSEAITLPTDAADVETWAEEIDFADFIAHLKTTDLPAELVQILEMLLS